ncbi:MAG: hypothetical protein AAFR07_10250 [Pseudomonadota bacterium]
MKPVVPIWTWFAYGAVGALTFVATDFVFQPSDTVTVAALQDSVPSENKGGESTPAEDTTPRPMSAEEEAELLEGVEGFSPDEPDPDAIREGDEAVDQILSELELIYEESDDNFIPTEPVSPDTTIDFPTDI